MTTELRNAILLRVIRAAVTIFMVMTFVFFLARMIGDPVTFAVPDDFTLEEIEYFKERLGLNDPILLQYADFLWDALRLDFGESFRAGRPAWDVVRDRLPATLQLSGAALVLSIVMGIPLGVIAAIRREGLIDYVARLLALFGQAVPNFWLGLMLILFVAVNVGWIPTGGRGGIESIILPAIVLGTGPAAAIMRFTRSAMLEALRQDYVRTARAKGLSEYSVVVRHALRNSLLSVVTLIGFQVGDIIGGSIIVETVFAWPGMGRLTIQSITLADFAVVQTAVLFTTVWLVSVNLFVDLSYMFLDPRIRAGTSL